MSEDKGGSKADTLVKVVLVFFISLLSFSVGTFVGKQVSDSDHRNLALEGVYNKGSRAVASVDDKDGEEETSEAPDKISEKEVENLTEEFVNKEKSREPAAEAKEEKHEEKTADEDESKTEAAPTATPPKGEGYKTYAHGKKEAAVEPEAEEPAKPADKAPEKKPAKPHAKAKTEAANEEEAPAKREAASEEAPEEKPKHTKKTAKAEDGLHEVTEKVIEGKAPSDGKKETRKPQAALPSVAATAVGKFAVQVASYADEAQAKEYSTTLKEKGFTTFYLSSNVKGKTWYRVLVGLFDNAKGAEEFKVQVAKELGVSSPIVRKIVE